MSFGSVNVQMGHKQVTVASGQSLSPAFDIESFRLWGVILPANIDGATALTFQVCATETGTFVNLFNDTGAGTEVSLPVAASRAVGVDALAGLLAPWRYMKIRLGTSGAAVVATANRTIDIVLKG